MWPVIEVGSGRVGTYGVLVTAGYLLGAAWLLCNRWQMRVPTPKFWQLAFLLLLGALLGAKLGYFFFEWGEFSANPRAFLRFWKIGWVFWPGFLSAILMGVLYQVYHNLRFRPRAFLPVADYFGTALAMGHTLGRLACFAEGCCHGRATSLPWGVRFTHPSCSVAPALLGVPLHPVQLLEAAGVLAICLFNVFYVLPNIRRKRLRYGTAFLGYIALYSTLRFFLEFLRGDDRGEFLLTFLSPSQWLSLAGLLVAGWLLRQRGVWEKSPDTRSIWLPHGQLLGLGE